MSELTCIAEGKTKILREVSGNPDRVWVSFKDKATAFNAVKIADVPGKGGLNATISALLFQWLEANGVSTCFLESGSKPDELLYERLKMIPLEVVVRNVAFGSLCKRFPQFEQGQILQKPLVEFFLKDDKANDPEINEGLIQELGILSSTQLRQVKHLALKSNDLLKQFFETRGITCADFKLEFGLNNSNTLKLGDELSPDNFRLRDIKTGQVLDKDVFRLDLADLGDTYKTLLSRLQVAQPSSQSVQGNTGDTPETSFEAVLLVTPRKEILHPESRTILEALHAMGYQAVEKLNAGKVFRVSLKAATYLEADQQLLEMADTLLSNPIVEDVELLSLEPVAKGAH
jgi:phosphoribosylaminoimidazole-succinocarboxamide synthase